MAKLNQLNYYQTRINKSVAYLSEHLEEPINMSKLAHLANFSLFHFQRIYKSIQGETPYDTLLRLRLEKAVFLLKYSAHLKVGEIAMQCGFLSPENFSRQFKARFDISPSAFRKNKKLHNSRIYQEDHKNDFYTCVELDSIGAWNVQIEEVSTMPIAFIRGIFATDGSLLVQRYQELIAWAEKNRVAYQGEMRRFGMSIDNPDVTPAGKYRYDFALKLERKHEPLELIEIGEIKGGKFATLHCEGDLMDVAKAWDYLYKVWLPSTSFVPKHQPAIEEFIQGPEEIGWTKFNVKCRIPIEESNKNIK